MAWQIAGPSPAELGRRGAAAALRLHHRLAQLRGARHEAGDLLDDVRGGAGRAGPGGQRDHGLRAPRLPGAAKLRAQRTPASELSTNMISSTHEDVGQRVGMGSYLEGQSFCRSAMVDWSGKPPGLGALGSGILRLARGRDGASVQNEARHLHDLRGISAALLAVRSRPLAGAGL